jgi:hypothetical protein
VPERPARVGIDPNRKMLVAQALLRLRVRSHNYRLAGCRRRRGFVAIEHESDHGVYPGPFDSFAVDGLRHVSPPIESSDGWLLEERRGRFYDGNVLRSALRCDRELEDDATFQALPHRFSRVIGGDSYKWKDVGIILRECRTAVHDTDHDRHEQGAERGRTE